MSQGMSPEDRAALIEIAGPFFAEANAIDNMYDPNHVPTSNGRDESGSGQAIKHALERDFAANGTAPQPPVHQPAPMPQYVPEVIPQHPEIVPQMQQAPMPQYVPPVPAYDDGQMELKLEYNPSAQKEGNRLLEKQNVLLLSISKKLNDLLDHIKDKHD